MCLTCKLTIPQLWISNIITILFWCTFPLCRHHYFLSWLMVSRTWSMKKYEIDEGITKLGVDTWRLSPLSVWYFQSNNSCNEATSRSQMSWHPFHFSVGSQWYKLAYRSAMWIQITLVLPQRYECRVLFEKVDLNSEVQDVTGTCYKKMEQARR